MTGGVVLVLGATGRNFGAGMSGGLAYIFDQEGSFPTRCNTDMVEFSALEAEDEANIRALLARHLDLTGSRRAKDLLARWEQVCGQFLRVLPRGMRATMPKAWVDLRARVAAAQG
jgi:glutamate synthase domain-containing protein 3